ncbi:hypothetical protein Cni_G18406 [Canna indica]|uniref:Uncharacterized protein n=1 Tax=Canna indica TaxID=4628 RepID=A0AAQ3KM64_9LILI|nr:hypothetical protein Cni_G18406 [Canna indica]
MQEEIKRQPNLSSCYMTFRGSSLTPELILAAPSADLFRNSMQSSTASLLYESARWRRAAPLHGGGRSCLLRELLLALLEKAESIMTLSTTSRKRCSTDDAPALLRRRSMGMH